MGPITLRTKNNNIGFLTNTCQLGLLIIRSFNNKNRRCG